MHRDRGSILLFVLFTLLVLTTLVYHIFTPYRQTTGETQALWIRDRGMNYLYSLENIAQKLLPRIDLNLYRQIKHIPEGRPVVIMLPVPEGMATAELTSENTCLNITLDTPPQDGQRKQLAQWVERLSSLVLHETNSGKLVMDALYPHARRVDSFTQGNSSLQTGTSATVPVPHALSLRQQNSLNALSPYLCRLSRPGQYIDINAIDTTSLVVLQTLLPQAIQKPALETVYANRGNGYWDSSETFIHKLPHPELISPDIRDLLHTDSQALKLRFVFNSPAGTFSATTHFSLNDRQLLIGRRDIINRNSL